VVECVETTECTEDTAALLEADGATTLTRLLLDDLTGALEVFATEGEDKMLETMLDTVL